MAERSLKELDLGALGGRTFSPSPAAWEDQVLYFLLLDRFSDGQEKGYRGNSGKKVTTGTTPPFEPADEGNAVRSAADAAAWSEAGSKWVGGTLKGLASKMGYLQRLGVTAVWVSPIFKQVHFQDTYHGYGIQDFLEVDPHFGTRDDLRAMVSTAHKHGIYVILDIILNHSGNVFGYDPDRYWTKDESTGNQFLDPRWDGQPYTVKGFHDAAGSPAVPFQAGGPQGHAAAWPHGAVWPAEFQDPAFYTQKGRINNWDHDPEFREGDFSDLKDIHLGQGHVDHYQPSPALRALCEVYKFWIAFADVDGYRVDTVKHMDEGASRFLTSVIHEFAQSLGKENFCLIGEITGGRERAFETLERTGMDAALGVDEIPDRLAALVKGQASPDGYFDLFRNSLLVRKESHVWFRNKVVTLYDDHDQVSKGQHKARFCALDPRWKKLAFNALALNATTLGIPCIYYGSEQRFDGEGGSDRYIREAMFGGAFGPFRSRGRHGFDEDGPVYKPLARLLALRKQKIALRRGRQYLREISGDGQTFGLPQPIGGQMRSIVPWSRLFNDQETLLALNTDPDGPAAAWAVVDAGLHHDGDRLKCIFSTDDAQVDQEATVTQMPGGAKAVWLRVPVAGFVIYE